MKKIFALLVMTSLILSGCGKQPAGDSVLMDAAKVKKAVNDWTVYTNPAYRYELRHPKTFDSHLVDEGGNEVIFLPLDKALSDTYAGDLRVRGFVNWRTQYSIEDYYKNQPVDLFAKGFDKEEITWTGFRAMWFKKVTGLVEKNPDQAIDVIAIDVKDRIVEMYIYNHAETTLTMVNSLYFYGNKSLSDIPEAPAPDVQTVPSP